MNETKRQIIRYAFYDQLALQSHFEKMAQKGWLIEKINSIFFQFRRITPQKLHVCVTYFPNASEFDPGPSENQQMMEAFAAKDGWKLITRWGQMQIFYSEADDPVPIETDPVTQVETIFRAMKKNLIPAHFYMLLLAIYQLAFNGYRAFEDPVDFLSTPYLFTSLPVWLLIALAEIKEIVTCLRWYKKAKPAAAKGTFLPVKTNYFITVILLLSAVFVLISTVQLPYGLRKISFMWIIVLIGILWLGHKIKNKLKQIGVSRGINYTVTILFTVFATIFFFSSLVFYGIRYGFDDGKQPVGTYEQNGWTFEIYDDELPLYVEDMIKDIENAEWSKEQTLHNKTVLLEVAEYRQDHIRGGSERVSLQIDYRIIDVKIPFLYDTIKQALLNERQDEVHDDFVFTDHYEPIDATPWQATEAYQLYWSGSILDQYVVCFDNRIVEIGFYWQPTPEQIRIAAEKLKPEH